MNAPIDVSFFARAAKPLTSYRKYWAARFGTAKFLPTSRAEMDALRVFVSASLRSLTGKAQNPSRRWESPISSGV
jgi:hypothetical protein